MKSFAGKINMLLEKKYPRPKIALGFRDPWQCLVATILSAQCTDKRVNLVTPVFFKKYKTVAQAAGADAGALEQIIHSTGFFRNKAKNIMDAAKKIVKDFGANVPHSMDELLTLSGVARKTANVVLYNAFGINEGIAVDTHVMRLSERLALSDAHDPVKIEQDLMRVLDRKKWGDFSLRLIAHGRETCFARKPLCHICILAKLCPSRGCYGGTT